MSQQRVLVVGGGIAGVSIAHELAAEYDVDLLEAEPTLAVHTTGRSAALFMLDYGPDAVRRLTQESAELYDAFSREPGTPPLLTERGALMTAWDDDGVEHLAAAVEATNGGLVPVSRDEAHGLCGFLRSDLLASAAFDRRARDIDVMGLHAHYVRGLRARGGTVHTGARVAAAARSPAGWQVTTLDGRDFSADRVVNAAGAWGDHVWTVFAVSGHRLQPLRRTIGIARVSIQVPPATPAVGDVQEEWYLKPEGEGVLLSPADETPDEPGNARPDELDVALAVERVNTVTTLEIRSVVTAWSGLRTFAPDRLPVVGRHPEDDTLFSFLGQGGFGIQMAPALARLGAECFRDGSRSELAAALAPSRSALQIPNERSLPCQPHRSPPAAAQETCSS